MEYVFVEIYEVEFPNGQLHAGYIRDFELADKDKDSRRKVVYYNQKASTIVEGAMADDDDSVSSNDSTLSHTQESCEDPEWVLQYPNGSEVMFHDIFATVIGTRGSEYGKIGIEFEGSLTHWVDFSEHHHLHRVKDEISVGSNVRNNILLKKIIFTHKSKYYTRHLLFCNLLTFQYLSTSNLFCHTTC